LVTRGDDLAHRQAIAVDVDEPIHLGRAKSLAGNEMRRPTPESALAIDERVVEIQQQQRHGPLPWYETGVRQDDA
jgi:hypothetical protein